MYVLTGVLFFIFKSNIMLEQLLNLVKENAGEAVVNNPAVPNEQNEGILQEAVSSITGGLKDQLAGGGAQDVLKTLGGQAGAAAGNPVVDNISEKFITNIVEKFGVNPQTAQSIASSVIPAVMGSLVNKTNDPNDSSFDLGGILSHLSGGKTSGLNLGGILQSLSGGLDKDHDGDVDLGDIAGMFTGGGAEAQPGATQPQGGGGIMGALKGMLGGNK